MIQLEPFRARAGGEIQRLWCHLIRAERLSLSYDTAAVYFGKREIMWICPTLDALLPMKTALHVDHEGSTRNARKLRKTG
jgi:hypothetical protein